MAESPPYYDSIRLLNWKKSLKFEWEGGGGPGGLEINLLYAYNIILSNIIKQANINPAQKQTKNNSTEKTQVVDIL